MFSSEHIVVCKGGRHTHGIGTLSTHRILIPVTGICAPECTSYTLNAITEPDQTEKDKRRREKCAAQRRCLESPSTSAETTASPSASTTATS